MDKKYLIIIGIIAGLIIVGLILFWLVFRPMILEKESPLSGIFPISGESPAGRIIPLSTTTPPTIFPGRQKQLFQLTKNAVSGAAYIEKERENKTKIGAVRYFEKATGHIYDIDYQTGASIRVSNTTIPGIFRIYWSPLGEQAVIRYSEKNETGIEDIARNFSILSVSATTTQGSFLSSKIESVAASPKENKIFYLFPFENSHIGMTASFSDKNQKQILDIPFGEFTASWPSERIIALLTKPSFNIGGHLYKLDPVTGSFESVLSGIQGLTALWSPDSEFILFNRSGYAGFNNFLYKIKENKTSNFDLATLPEKCAWSKIKKGALYCAVPISFPGAKYPDDWYQGIVSFSDRIWKIDVINGTSEIISDEISDSFDFINPFSDKNENYLFFINKKDGALWGLRL